MLRLHYSNRIERLVGALCDDLARRRRGGHPLDPVEIVVPNRATEAWLRCRIGEALGVAGPLRTYRLDRYASELAARSAGSPILVDQTSLRGAILAVLHGPELEGVAGLEPLGEYLEGGDLDEGLAKAQVADRMAVLFQEYLLSRRAMVDGWRRGELEDPEDEMEIWQRSLWMAVAGPGGILDEVVSAGSSRWITVADLVQPETDLASAPGGSLVVFGLSHVARTYLELFRRISDEGDLDVYALNPCREFWEDVQTEAERFKDLGRLPGGVPPGPGDDPFGLFDDTDTPLLRLWGRPGRELIRVLDEIAECDFFDSFEEPRSETVLGALQRDVLDRHGDRREDPLDLPPDDTVRVLFAPTARREIEAVAEAVWRLAAGENGSGPVRFTDIAILVASSERERYLGLLDSVFETTHRIPWRAVDLPSRSASRILDLARALLELPFGDLTRAEVLTVMEHPAVAGGRSAAERWRPSVAADELGIVVGGDRDDLAGTYVERDLFTWDQGLRRLALGAFLAGPRSGNPDPFRVGDHAYLPTEVSPSHHEEAGRFALLARSLVEDARNVRGRELPLTRWAEIFRALLLAYAAPVEPGEQAVLDRCVTAMEGLRRMDVRGDAIPAREATSLALDLLEGLRSGGDPYPAGGVRVGSLGGLRGLPFHTVFVVGANEGEFPAPMGEEAVDLRTRGRRAGDVSPPERDRYLLLEALLSARAGFVVSGLDRDEDTGEERPPATVVSELVGILDGYLSRGSDVIDRIPARRRDDRGRFDVLPGAARERRAADWGEEVRRRLGVEPGHDNLEVARRRLPDDELAKILDLLRIPSPPPVRRRETLSEMTLRDVRGFLESPLQTWAGVVAGLEADEDDGSARVEDEPLDSNPGQEAVLFRHALEIAFREGVSPGEAYRSLADREELAGRYPTGTIGAMVRRRHVEVVDGWGRALEERGLSVGTVERIRFGRAPESATIDTICPAIETEGPGEEPAPRIVGHSGLLLDGRRISIVVDRSSTTDKRRPYKYGLRGVVAHLALAAAGVIPEDGRRMILILRPPPALGEEVRVEELSLPSVRRGRAMRYLGTLGTDLDRGDPPGILPCEAVFDVWLRAGRDLAGVDPARVRSAVMRWTSKGSSNRWGPIRDPAAVDPPSLDEIARILEVRWSLPLTLLGGGRRSGG